jgi:hypothetical protein
MQKRSTIDPASVCLLGAGKHHVKANVRSVAFAMARVAARMAIGFAEGGSRQR